MSGFEDLGLCKELVDAIKAKGWDFPRDVQAEGIPAIMGGDNVILTSQTGSGKTGAICLPLLQTLHEFQHGRAQVPFVQSELMRATPSVVVTDDYVVHAGTSRNWGGATGQKPLYKGKWYFEYEIHETGTSGRGGIVGLRGSRIIGVDSLGYGFGATGTYVHADKYERTPYSYALGDVMSVQLNLDDNVITFFKNGEQVYTTPVAEASKPFFPGVSVSSGAMQIRFGPFPRLPHGYKPYSSAKMKEVKEDVLFGLVLEPTRELANQIYKDQLDMSQNIRTPQGKPLVIKMQTETDTHFRGDYHIGVTTLGRAASISLPPCRFVLVDEVDSFQSNLGTLHRVFEESYHPARQMVACSATSDEDVVEKLQQLFCVSNITLVDTIGTTLVPENINHVVYHVDNTSQVVWQDGLNYLADIYKKKNITDHLTILKYIDLRQLPDFKPVKQLDQITHVGVRLKVLKYIHLLRQIGQFATQQMMVFFRTKAECDLAVGQCTDLLGANCAALHAGATNREATLKGFINHKIQLMFCTDVAARGIHVQGLDLVLNFTLPNNTTDYIHRIGRCGRASRKGTAINLVASGEERVWYHDRCKNPITCGNQKCVMTMHEPTMLKDIEYRVKHKVPTLSSEDLNQGADYLRSCVHDRQPTLTNKNAIHMAVIQPQCKQLYALEHNTQKLWLNEGDFAGAFRNK